jgi:hypothetical protein
MVACTNALGEISAPAAYNVPVEFVFATSHAGTGVHA